MNQAFVPYHPPYWCHTRWSRLWYRLFGGRYWLHGEIRIGDKFIWEPTILHACCHITVFEVVCNGEEWWIRSTSEQGGLRWNDEARFREACVREE